jgi:hypothetical protein
MSNEIMNVNENAIAKAENSADFEIPRGYICTVDITTMDGKLDVMNALNGSTALAEHEGETLIVKNIVTTQGVRSRTGEACTNTHLLLADGTTLFSQSDGVKRSVEVLVALFTINGVCNFGDGIPVKLVSQKLNNGNTLKTLVPVRD